jgi:hypothetical protein
MEFQESNIIGAERRDNGEASSETSKMTGWLIKYSGGVINDKKQAALVLVGIAVFAFLFSVILFVSAISGADTSEPPTSPEIENAGSPKYM